MNKGRCGNKANGFPLDRILKHGTRVARQAVVTNFLSQRFQRAPLEVLCLTFSIGVCTTWISFVLIWCIRHLDNVWMD